jgi:hypothetical protein
MPPLLHPRSTATSTLFAGTLLASFIVVGIPHVFPCPRPRQQYLDAEGNKLQLDADGKPVVLESQVSSDRRPNRDIGEAAVLKMLQEEAKQLDQRQQQARECPVPKPSGWIGKVLGFDGSNNATSSSKQSTKT